MKLTTLAAFLVVSLAAPSHAQLTPGGVRRAPNANELGDVSACGEITLAPIPRPELCVGYSAVLSVAGGVPPLTFSVASGALPAGLSLTDHGLLSGVPTSVGPSSFTLHLTDQLQCQWDVATTVVVTVGFRAPNNQVELSIPPLGSGGSGNPAQDRTLSSLQVAGIAADVAIFDVEVHVTLSHERDGDLALTLVAPDATRISLANQRGGSGANFMGTVFTDAATAPIDSGAAPFAGVFRPEQPLGVHAPNGTWTLEIEDKTAGNVGRLLDWSLDLTTAALGPASAVASERWSRTIAAASSAQGLSRDETHVYYSAGTTTGCIQITDTLNPGTWSRDFFSFDPQRPLVVQLYSGALVTVTGTSSGFVYCLGASNGTTLWTRDTRRAGCAADTLAAAPVSQGWYESNSAFRTAIVNEDLLFFGTTFGCGTTTANRVLAIKGSDGTLRWSFNATGAFQVDRVTGLAIDRVLNRVYAATYKTNSGATQDTLFALNSITGAKVWSRDLGAISAKPILSDRGLYVLARSGELHLVDPSTGADIWSFTLSTTEVFDNDLALDPLRHMSFVAGSSGRVRAIVDNGASASSPWSLDIGASFQAVAAAPFQGKLYVGAGNGRVHQLDELTGVLENYATVLAATPVTQLLVGGSPGGSAFVEARLAALASTRVDWLTLDWSGSGDHGGGGGHTDSTSGPNNTLVAQGSTTPGNPGVGQNAVDTLSVTNTSARSIDCVELRAPLPAGMSFVGATATQGSVALESGEIVARFGRTHLSQPVGVVVTLQVLTPGSHSRTYTATSPPFSDPTPGDNVVILN